MTPRGEPDATSRAAHADERWGCTRLDDTIEGYLSTLSGRGGAVYGVLLLALAGAGLAAPLVRVPVVVQAAGSVRPALERHEVRASRGGLVRQAFLGDGARTSAGQPLVVLEAPAIIDGIERLTSAIGSHQQALDDLSALLDSGPGDTPPMLPLETSRAVADRARVLGELRLHDLDIAFARRELSRLTALSERGFATDADVHARRRELARASLSRAASWRNARSAWEAERERLSDEIDALRAELERLRADASHQHITAPVHGVIEESRRLAPGSAVQPGELLAIVSPDQPLVADLHLRSSDIALVRPGMSVTFRLDAFRSGEWQPLRGRIDRVSDDVALIDQAPVFRVRCSLDVPYVVTKDGRRAGLRKGMTLTARIHVANRTVWQLLRDDMTEWIDPASPR